MIELNRQERVYWTPKDLVARDRLGTVVFVAVTDWEASFDAGVTYVSARDNGGEPSWLVAGVDYPGPGDDDGGIVSDAVIPRGTRRNILIRHRDIPETPIFDKLIIYSP